VPVAGNKTPPGTALLQKTGIMSVTGHCGMMKPFAVAGMPQRDFPARVRRVEHMATMLPMTAACPGVMVRCSERAGSKAIFAKRTHLKIKLNPTGSNLVKPGQTWSNLVKPICYQSPCRFLPECRRWSLSTAASNNRNNAPLPAGRPVPYPVPTLSVTGIISAKITKKPLTIMVPTCKYNVVTLHGRIIYN
jgi:hypothetical protein